MAEAESGSGSAALAEARMGLNPSCFNLRCLAARLPARIIGCFASPVLRRDMRARLQVARGRLLPTYRTAKARR